MFFVNLPLRYLAAHPEAPEIIARLAPGGWLGVELGLDAATLDGLTLPPGQADPELPDGWHARHAAILAEHNIACGVHLPFQDLKPASFDPLIRQASQERLAQALRVARVYSPLHLIGHPGLQPTDAFDSHAELRARSLQTWGELLQSWPDHPPLFLENTFDPSPEPLAALAELLPPDCGVCFDLGHWHAFARGSQHQDMDRWVATLAPRLGHLHLHDNHGIDDEHLSLGRGDIDWPLLTRLLAEHGLAPNATLEPHSERDLVQTVTYLRRHPEFLPWLERE